MAKLNDLVEQMRRVVFPSLPYSVFVQVHAISDNVIPPELVLSGFEMLGGAHRRRLLGIGSI